MAFCWAWRWLIIKHSMRKSRIPDWRFHASQSSSSRFETLEFSGRLAEVNMSQLGIGHMEIITIFLL